MEKYKSLVSVIQQNMHTLKQSVDTEIIMDYLEPFEAAGGQSKVGSKEEERNSAKKEGPKSSTVVKKRHSGDFSGGPLSKKTHNNLSAKDLRQRVTSPTDNTSSSKDVRLPSTLSKKPERTFSAKDVRVAK